MADSTSIPSLRAKSNITFKQNPSPQNNDEVTFNAAPQINQEAVTDAVSSAPLANKVMEMHEIPTEVLAPTAAGVWLGSNYLVDKLNKNLAKDYSETFYGKIAENCDKFSENTWLGKKVQAAVDWTGTATDRLAQKSRIIQSLKLHSTKPEWGFAKFPFYGLKGFLGMDLTSNVFETCTSSIVNDSWFGKFANPIKYEKLLDVGMSPSELEAFERGLTGSKSQKAIATLKRYLKLIGADATEIQNAINGLTDDKDVIKKLKEMEESANITKRLGFNFTGTPKEISEEFKKFKELAQDKPEEVLRVLERLKQAHPNRTMTHWKPYKLFGSRTLGKIVGNIVGRNSSWGEYANKYKVAMGNGARSTLGKFATKSLAWLQEAATGRFAFGKLFAIMAAVEVSKALIHTVKADGIKEKFKTGAERGTDLIATAVSATGAIIGMHKIGGFKYIGLDTEAERLLYESEQAELNRRNRAGDFINRKNDFKAEAKRVKSLLHPERIKNPIHKLLYYTGNLINSGNGNTVSYVGSSKVMNVLRKCANSNIIGVPLRIWLGAFVFAGWITKTMLGAEHKIFGKPKFSIEDEEKMQEAASEMVEAKPVDINSLPDSNLIKQANERRKQQAQQVEQTQTSNKTEQEQNSTNNQPKQNNSDEPVRTYIPSPQGVVLQAEDTSGADKALAEADLAEKAISDILDGKGY